MCPTSAMRSPWTSTSPGAVILPVSMSSKRAAWSTIGSWRRARKSDAAVQEREEASQFISGVPAVRDASSTCSTSDW